MNNIIDTNEASARAYFRDLVTMITRNHGREKTTQETPSPRGVADGSFGDYVEEAGQQTAFANAIEDCARAFLLEVLRNTISMTEHCRRMSIRKRDVSYALEFFHRPRATCEYIGEEDTDEVDDDKEDWNMDAEENGAEESEEQEEEDDDEDEEEDEEEDEDVGYNLITLPFSNTETKKFKNILLLPMLEELRTCIPVANDAVVLLRDAMYSFVIEKFSE